MAFKFQIHMDMPGIITMPAPRKSYMDNLQARRHLTVPDDLSDSISHLGGCEPIKAIPIGTSLADTPFARRNVRP